MKVRCPRCRQKITVADKFAGKAIRCPSCNRGFALPKPQAAVGADAESGLDLQGLAELESSSELLSRKEMAKVRAAEASEQGDKSAGRICPSCHKSVRAADPYTEVLCSHCWQPIPALLKGGRVQVAVSAALARRRPPGEGSAAFYAELTSCLTYPLSAFGSVVAAALIAVAAGLVPVAVITGGLEMMHQYTVGTIEEKAKTDLSGATMLLMIMFGCEVLVFAAIAMHLFLDVVRTTSIKNDKPPSLAWAPSKWGKSLFACVILVTYYALMTYLVATVTVKGDFLQMLMQGHFKDIAAAGGANLMIGLVLVSAGIPMSLIGISLTSALQGLNPINVGQSIGRTHAHYAFLVLLLSLYGIMFVAAFAGILFDWFLPQFAKMVQGSAEGDLAQVAFSLLAWGGVMGFFFYGTYVLARLHGVFARSFRKQLAFGG